MLPGAVVFGTGLVTFVAPLTATVMAAADPDHVNVASAVNNAVARAASLFALAAIPVLSGLSTAAGHAEVTHSFRVALVISAAMAAAAAPLAFIGLMPTARARPASSRRQGRTARASGGTTKPTDGRGPGRLGLAEARVRQ